MALRIMGFLKTLIFCNRLNGCTHIDTKRRRSCLIERGDMPARFLLGVEDGEFNFPKEAAGPPALAAAS